MIHHTPVEHIFRELAGNILTKASQIDESGDYRDSKLENGTYADGYCDALTDFLKELRQAGVTK